MIVDVHAHLAPPGFVEEIRRAGNHWGIQVTRSREGAEGFHVDGRFLPFPPAFYDISARLAEMERMGVDHQVISAVPLILFYDREPRLAHAMAQMTNDSLAAASRAHPRKFTPMASLPMQDTSLALEEMERACGELGMRAVEIGASAGERELDHPDLDPFWAEVERRGLAVFIHPVKPPARRRLDDFYLFNIIGFLTETTLAAGRLIFGGVLDRHPSLRILLAHAGGQMLFTEGRFDHCHRYIRQAQGTSREAPSAYLRRLYYDTITYHPRALGFVVEAVGAERVLMGTDHPFGIFERDPVRLVDAVPGLGEAQREAICGGNAARLFGLDG